MQGYCISSALKWTLLWRHNGLDGVSNRQRQHCFLNRLFRRRSKKTWKLRVTGRCVGNSPVTGEFPAQMASYAENVSIWWRHHEILHSCMKPSICKIAIQRNTRKYSMNRNACLSLYIPVTSTTDCLFNSFFRLWTKEISKCDITDPLRWGAPSDHCWIPFTKGQWRSKRVHGLTSLWHVIALNGDSLTEHIRIISNISLAINDFNKAFANP